MTDDPMLAAVQKFMDAVESRLAKQDERHAEEIRSLREQLQTRSVVSEPVIDIDAIVTRAASLIPVPKDGRDGVDGKDGAPGKDGIDGKDGTPGQNGTPGERGADGINGRDGKDGIATREEIDSLVEQRVEARFAEVQVRSFADIYQGTYSEKETYRRGVTATWDGSLWMSERETNKQPGTTDSGWKLITKRGRDGRDRR